MIRRIAVKGYKSLRNVELTLKPLTVIIGPNATGKSNLFDALHLLKRIVRSRTLAERLKRITATRLRRSVSAQRASAVCSNGTRRGSRWRSMWS